MVSVLGLVSVLGFLICIVMLVIAAIKKTSKVKQWSIASAACFVVFVIFIAMSNTPASKTVSTTQDMAKVADKSPEQIAQEKADTEAKAKEIPGTIGLKPDEFKDRWNSITASRKIPNYKISKINVEDGQIQNTFQYHFNDIHGLLGTVNKADGSIRDVIIFAGGKGLADTDVATKVILSWGILIQTTNQDLSPSELVNILTDLGAMEDNVNLTEINTSTVRGNIKYHLQGTKNIGIWFGASSIKDSK